jgi:hypothetical protein
MKKAILINSSILLIFFLGFFTRQFILIKQVKSAIVKKVAGICDVFFKYKDLEKVREWYPKHMGFNLDQYGTSFEWHKGDDPIKYGFTQLSAFSDSIKYFGPSVKEFMINYRVQDMLNLVTELKMMTSQFWTQSETMIMENLYTSLTTKETKLNFGNQLTLNIIKLQMRGLNDLKALAI